MYLVERTLVLLFDGFELFHKRDQPAMIRSWTGSQVDGFLFHRISKHLVHRKSFIQHIAGGCGASLHNPSAVTQSPPSSFSKHHRSPTLSSHPTRSPPAHPTAHSHSHHEYYQQSIYEQSAQGKRSARWPESGVGQRNDTYRCTPLNLAYPSSANRS
jgi:hypothetical protein